MLHGFWKMFRNFLSLQNKQVKSPEVWCWIFVQHYKLTRTLAQSRDPLLPTILCGQDTLIDKLIRQQRGCLLQEFLVEVILRLLEMMWWSPILPIICILQVQRRNYLVMMHSLQFIRVLGDCCVKPITCAEVQYAEPQVKMTIFTDPRKTDIYGILSNLFTDFPGCFSGIPIAIYQKTSFYQGLYFYSLPDTTNRL